MKTLYNVILESILDDQDDVMDKMTDDLYTRVGQTIAEWCKGKYNPKSRTIKAGAGYVLQVIKLKGRICIYNYKTHTLNPIDEIAGVQVGLDGLKDYKFDCDISLYLDAVELGFTLDKIQWIGKQHILYIHRYLHNSIGVTDLTKIIGSSQIPPGSKLDISSEYWDQDLLTNNICSKFDAVHVAPQKLNIAPQKLNIWNTEDQLGILKNCKAQKLIIDCAREWLDIDRKCKTISDAINDKKSGFTVARQLKNFIANNPGVTLIISPDSIDWEVVDKDLNCKKLSGSKYWTKA